MNIPVHEIMSTNLKIVHPKDKMQSAKEIFEEYDLHHILVAVMGEVRGIISLGDMLFLEGVAKDSFDEFLRKKKYELSTVDEIMTPRPYCIDQDSKISEVLDIMIEKRINSIPVINGSELVGIVTNHDFQRDHD